MRQSAAKKPGLDPPSRPQAGAKAPPLRRWFFRTGAAPARRQWGESEGKRPLQKSGPSHLHFLENLMCDFRFSRNKTADYYFGPYAPAQPKKTLAELPQIMRDHVELANGIYRESYELLIDGETDTFFFQFDDAWTDALPVSITAAEL